ncbi:peptide deformylase [Candidatus Microgenomates bacterium]|nr:peptide deformylase [Candidatus Microgenomates bacterium]
MLKILRAPQSILSQPAKRVEKINKKILEIIDEMKVALNQQSDPEGVGLAAPQVGYSLKIFITKPTSKSAIRVFINPEITWLSDDLTSNDSESKNPLEGCLSLPKIWGPVQRHKSLKLRYLTPDGQSHEELFKDFLAVIIQHEMDHLEGRLFTQRVLLQKGKLYQTVGKNEDGSDIFEEVEVS